MDTKDLGRKLDALTVKVDKNVQLENYTHTKTGGEVAAVFYPENKEQLIESIKFCRENRLKFEILAGMTNVAIASGTLDFMVINMQRFNVKEPKLTGRKLTVSASYKMKDLTIWGLKNRVRDLAWMEGIPGTIGAGIFMNAGFLSGQDMAHLVLDVKYLNTDTFEIKTISNKEINFKYRFSDFQNLNCVILEATLLVAPVYGMKHSYMRMLKSKRLIKKYHNRRVHNQPLELPSAGTVFVPPTPYHVGGMLRELGLVGFRQGGAQISKKSPGFIVGIDNMTGEHYADMVEFIKNKVFENYGVQLETEVRLLGFNGTKR